MRHELERVLAERLASGLRRSTITSCSRWAENCRVMGKPFPGPWTFKHHPWLREMCDAEAELIVGQKAAQMGFTEVALNKTFFNIDIKGVSVLYILPATTPDAGDFSTSRFDPALELSPHLSTLFSDVKNIGHKRAGSANLFIRGSRSRSQLKSIPVGLVVGDELDEMDQDNIPLIFERMAGQEEKQAFFVSTATIDNFGINKYFRSSTEEHFIFKCPSCSRFTELSYPECLVVTAEDLTDSKITNSHLVCRECKNRLEHKTKVDWLKDGKWIKSHTDRLVRGFHINQMYSMTATPVELATCYLRAQHSPSDEQEFFNSKLGLTHVVEGAKIKDSDILECTGSHVTADAVPGYGLTTMGVDVGKWLHVEIDQWFFDDSVPTTDINLLAKSRVIAEFKLLHFEELDLKMQDFGIRYCVIDANPERRKALEFAQRFAGRVRLCFYGTGVNGKQINLHAEEERTITVDRTSWMDLALGRFRTRTIVLPRNLSLEYKSHLKAPVRIYEKDSDGNPIGRYVKGNEDDHFAHARTYAEIALPLAASLARSEDIGDVL